MSAASFVRSLFNTPQFGDSLPGVPELGDLLPPELPRDEEVEWIEKNDVVRIAAIRTYFGVVIETYPATQRARVKWWDDVTEQYITSSFSVEYLYLVVKASALSTDVISALSA